MLAPPIDLPKWLEENGQLLQPPINNYCAQRGGYTVMIVGGPNRRNDYHVNETPEWFYQYKGAMLLRVVDDNQFRDIEIGEGCMFLLPANTPHNPVRFADTVGIVVEQDRPLTSLDKLRWYCESEDCRKQLRIVYEESFHCTDLGTQIKEVVERVAADPKLRTCAHCGTIVSVK